MNIYVNNKPQELPVQSRLKDALDALQVTAQKGVAVAINNNVIPRAEWDTYELKAEDKMMLIKATQGG